VELIPQLPLASLLNPADIDVAIKTARLVIRLSERSKPHTQAALGKCTVVVEGSNEREQTIWAGTAREIRVRLDRSDLS
jgi:hypothetical protein